MRPNLEYIIEKFEYYNKLCFDGTLQRPPIRLTLRYATMGCTKCIVSKDIYGKIHNTDFSIEISVRRDLPEIEYTDTIVHEMIHYYILSNNLIDSSPHGSLFISKMNEIREKYGIKVTIAFDPTEEDLIQMRSHPRYVCVIDFKDERTGIAVVARSKIFQYWDAMAMSDDVRETSWYVSDRAIFEKFHTYVSLGCDLVDADKIQHYLTGAQELERIGNIIKTK